MIAIIVSALALGFLGSFHCVGMCGPIVLAVPFKGDTFIAKLKSALYYNVGRAVTYSVGGALFGLLGMGFVIAGYQQLLSIIVGVVLLLAVFIPEKYYSSIKVNYAVVKIKNRLGKLLVNPSGSPLFLIGVLNGMLPCGLVYIALAAAVATGSWYNGAMFMMFFGIGTFPAMAAIFMLSSKIGINSRNKIRKLVPVMVTAMALLLVLRGLNLGIPYISPDMNANDNTKHKCCHK